MAVLEMHGRIPSRRLRSRAGVGASDCGSVRFKARRWSQGRTLRDVWMASAAARMLRWSSAKFLTVMSSDNSWRID